jgi:hypothetical protein
MANRRLLGITYIHSVPVYGRCSKCGRPFTTPSDATANPLKAMRDFYAVFQGHKCDEDASQAAARIVREATEE